MNSSLSLQRISKKFGATVALADVSLDMRAGEVHALLGENGAGKSTLMHIAYGMLRADSGTIAVRRPDGIVETIPAFSSPRAARDAGIGMVHQHFTSIPALTVSENIALTAGWRDTGSAAERRAALVTERLALPLPVSAHVDGLSVQLRQRLEIVKALAADARVLLLDEPSAVLAPREVDELLIFVRRFAEGGGTVLLITHKLAEVFRVADHVTVLRRGQVTLDDRLAGRSPQALSRAMIGGELPRATQLAVQSGEVLVRVSSAAATFEVRAGEIMGVAAIDGNGQRELLRTIAGVDNAQLVGDAVEVTGPVAFIPDDRIAEGLIGAFSLTENLLLGTLDRSDEWLDWNAIRARTTTLMHEHDVRAASADAAAETLSGGNQQKFILARALEGTPRVIVAEDPTRGLDLLATQAIHERLRAAARNGAAVLFHSSDIDEVLELSSRLLVMAHGRAKELPRDTPRDLVGDAMLALEPVA